MWNSSPRCEAKWHQGPAWVLRGLSLLHQLFQHQILAFLLGFILIGINKIVSRANWARHKDAGPWSEPLKGPRKERRDLKLTASCVSGTSHASSHGTGQQPCEVGRTVTSLNTRKPSPERLKSLRTFNWLFGGTASLRSCFLAAKASSNPKGPFRPPLSCWFFTNYHSHGIRGGLETGFETHWETLGWYRKNQFGKRRFWN